MFTERAGRLRLSKNNILAENDVLTFDPDKLGEGGLMGIALHPNFSQNNQFYVYYTGLNSGVALNKVERYILSADHKSARFDRIVVDKIPSGTFHDGGSIQFGPDGKLYISTGYGNNINNSQDMTNLAGKLLRLNDDGTIPEDNPFKNSPIYALGIRNSQGFTWVGHHIILADHGPSGEAPLNLSGLDEINFVQAGDNLGWPLATGCSPYEGKKKPSLLFGLMAAPPAGMIYYTGDKISNWKNSVILATLKSKRLYRLKVVEEMGRPKIESYDYYLANEYGRLRALVQSPSGEIFATTSNCDTRGVCPEDKDYILKINQE